MKHLGQFWAGTMPPSGSVFGWRQHFIAELRTSLPGATPPLVAPSDAELRAFATKATNKFNEFSMQFKSLSLIDQELSASVEQRLEVVEDVLTTYVAALGASISVGRPVPDRSDAVSALTDSMLRLFKQIQDHQVQNGSM